VNQMQDGHTLLVELHLRGWVCWMSSAESTTVSETASGKTLNTGLRMRAIAGGSSRVLPLYPADQMQSLNGSFLLSDAQISMPKKFTVLRTLSNNSKHLRR
jgi:hypothetical protein